MKKKIKKVNQIASWRGSEKCDWGALFFLQRVYEQTAVTYSVAYIITIITAPIVEYTRLLYDTAPPLAVLGIWVYNVNYAKNNARGKLFETIETVTQKPSASDHNTQQQQQQQQQNGRLRPVKSSNPRETLNLLNRRTHIHDIMLFFDYMLCRGDQHKLYVQYI